MKILIAPDSFKGSLTAPEVAKSLATGLEKAASNFKIIQLPLADGGEGTVKSLVAATEGQLINKKVIGPLGKEVQAYFGILGNQETAVIEMAAASGLPLVAKDKQNPKLTTTYGTGQLIKTALDEGCKKIIVGIGGSATTDAGIGMAQALGAKFLNSSGKEVGFGGQALEKITQIDLTELDPRLKELEIEVACDVDNPLHGPNGAAYVYGPQKGATPEMVKELDVGLKNIAKIIKHNLNKEVAQIPGAGAAGGLGAGLVAFLDAQLKPGIEIVLKASKIEDLLPNIDLVITGEGQIDAQTAHGKTPIGVAKVAKKYSLPVIAIAGSLAPGADDVYQHGIDAIFSIINRPMALSEAEDNATQLLEELGENLGRMIELKIGVNNYDHQ